MAVETVIIPTSLPNTCVAHGLTAWKKYMLGQPQRQKKLQHAAQPNAGWKDVPELEELTLWKTGKNYTANPEKAYMKPIYILTDGQPILPQRFQVELSLFVRFLIELWYQ